MDHQDDDDVPLRQANARRRIRFARNDDAEEEGRNDDLFAQDREDEEVILNPPQHEEVQGAGAPRQDDALGARKRELADLGLKE